MSKIVKISGGLGNQLFQYSFGRFLEEKFQVEVKYDLQTIQKSKNFTNREPLINELVSDLKVINMPYYNNSIIYNIKRKIIGEYFPKLTDIFVENIFKDCVINPSTLLNKFYFDGHWQSLKYLTEIEDKLRLEIQFDKSLSKLCSKEYLDIIQSNSCSIHIRRGDYLLPHNTQVFAQCGVDFYNKAIQFILEKSPETSFFIFSDDIKWAKNIFVGPIYNFVDRFESNPIIDLFLMSNCKNNIISNSTFSWWASWLNFNTSKIILCPQNWFVDDRKNSIIINNLIDKSHILI